MRIQRIVKPGEKVPDSGIYQSSITQQNATLVEGKRAPSTPKPGEVWKQIVDTNESKLPNGSIRIHG